MTAPAKRKDHPLSMRLPEADISVIDRAALLRGRSRTDFVRDAAVRAAEEVLMENTLLRMGEDSFAAFMDAVTAPAKPVPEMVAMFSRPAPWEGQHTPAFNAPTELTTVTPDPDRSRGKRS